MVKCDGVTCRLAAYLHIVLHDDCLCPYPSVSTLSRRHPQSAPYQWPQELGVHMITRLQQNSKRVARASSRLTLLLVAALVGPLPTETRDLCDTGIPPAPAESQLPLFDRIGRVIRHSLALDDPDTDSPSPL